MRRGRSYSLPRQSLMKLLFTRTVGRVRFRDTSLLLYLVTAEFQTKQPLVCRWFRRRLSSPKAREVYVYNGVRVRFYLSFFIFQKKKRPPFMYLALAKSVPFAHRQSHCNGTLCVCYLSFWYEN